MRYSFAFIFMLTGLFNLKSQDFKKDILMVYEQQNKTDNLCFNIVYTLHQNHNANSKIIYKSIGKYIKIKDKSLTSLDHITSVVLPDMTVMINSQEKRIVIKKEKPRKITQPDIMTQLKGYEGFIEKVIPLKSGKDLYIYLVELKKSAPYPISKYEISINSKSKSITKLSLFYKNKLEKDDDYSISGNEVPRLDIEFNDYNNFKLFNEAELSSSFYFSQNKNKFFPTQNFKSYDIKLL